MKLLMNYGTDALLLPATVAEHLHKATKRDLSVLLALAAEPLSRLDLEAACAAVAARLSLAPAEVEAALAFWRGAGVVLTEEGDAAVAAAPAAKEAPAVPRVVTERGMPVYSSEELSGVLERRGELAGLIDACQRTFGKIFNNFALKLLAVILGSVIYYIVIQLVVSTMDINTNLLKLISALIVAAFLAVPYWKKHFFPKKIHHTPGKEKEHA